MPEDTGKSRIPIVEERARIEKRVIPTARVRVMSQVDERLEVLREELVTQTLAVERVAVNREADAPSEIRTDGDVLIIPVFEQRLVVEKRWFITEEVRVRRQQQVESVEIPVELRSTHVSVERAEAAPHSEVASDSS